MQGFTRFGMDDIQPPGMKRQPPEIVVCPVMSVDRSFSVGRVADDWMADVVQVSPHLMFATVSICTCTSEQRSTGDESKGDT